jgi:hypothetical protein
MDCRFRGSLVDVLGELEVDSVKGHDQVLVIIDLFEGANNARFTANTPNKVLVGKSIVQAHAFLVDQRQVILVHGRRVIAIEAELADKKVSDCSR